MVLALSVLSGFVLAVFAGWITQVARRWTGWLLALLPAALFFYYLGLLPDAIQGRAHVFSAGWAPQAGIYFSFYVDALSLLFCLLITGIGTFIFIYTGGYLKGHPEIGRMYQYLLMFMGAMLGTVTASNVVTLFVFWELTSLTSFLLIGFNHAEERSRRAALQALIVTGGGGLALLAGLLIMGQIVGSMEMPEILASGDVLRSHPLYLEILFLVLAGAITKSAQFPFHFWLPSAMEAPTPVSAYLHSATMVKAGVYLLARLHPALGGTGEWAYYITGAGLATVLTGSIVSLMRTDMKQLLAYSTVAALGSMVMMMGLGTPFAIKSGLTFLLAHALYKGSLFISAGAVDHEAGSRDVQELGGLRRYMPITFLFVLLAALSKAGIIPVISYIGKEGMLEAGLKAGAWPVVASLVLMAASFVAVALIIVVRVFCGSDSGLEAKPHEGPVSLWIGPAVLSVLGVGFGAFVWIVDPFLSAAAGDALGVPHELKLSVWHGFNAALGLSVLALALGAIIYRWWDRIRERLVGLGKQITWWPERLYDAGMDLVGVAAVAQTRVLQSGYLRYYLFSIVLSVVALVVVTLLRMGEPLVVKGISGVRWYEWPIALIIVVAAITATVASSRLAAIAALGVVGTGVALIFVIYGAPDLAMTQFVVETLLVILFVLVFYNLPRFSTLSSTAVRVRDAVVALSAGATMAFLVLVAANTQITTPISHYYSQTSLPQAYGRNIVNVILVDFRALDTLGEITVLALAALGVYGLIRLRLKVGGPE